MEQRGYSVAEASTILGLSESTVRRMVTTSDPGPLAHVRVGRRIVIPKWAIDQLLDTSAAV